MRLALAAVLLGFAPGLFEPFTPFKAAVLRLTGLPMLAALVVELAVRRGRRAWRPRPLDAAVLAWSVAAGLSAAFGISPRLSLAGEIEQREGLWTTVALAGLYFAARRSHRSAREARGTLLTIVGIAAAAAVYAMGQRIGLDPLAWESASSYPIAGGSVVRVFATLGNPILLGSVLAAALGIGLARASEPGARPAWLVPVLVLIACALAATLSRGAALAALAAVAAAAGFAAFEWGRASLRRIAAVLAMIGIPTALWTFVALRSPIAARVGESLDARAESLPARLEMAKSAIAMALERPWLGFGPDTFGLVFPAFQTAGYWRNSWLGNSVHAHSVVLQVPATGGLLALAVGLAWWLLLGRALARRTGEVEAGDPGWAGARVALAAGLASLAIAGAVNPVGLAGAAVFFALSGLVPAATAGEVEEAPPHPASPPAAGARAALGAAIVLVLVAIPAWREGRALAAAGAARSALSQSIGVAIERQLPRMRESLRQSRIATGLAPGEDALWRLRCDAALAQAGLLRSPRGAILAAREIAGGSPGDVETAIRVLAARTDSLGHEAEQAARRSLSLEPLRASNLQRLANALALRGGFAQADSAFDAAHRLAPWDPLILVDRVRTEMARGRPDAALRTARRIVEMYPDQATGHALEAGAWIVMGRSEEARGALERALASRWEAEFEEQRVAAERALRAIASADSIASNRSPDDLPRPDSSR